MEWWLQLKTSEKFLYCSTNTELLSPSLHHQCWKWTLDVASWCWMQSKPWAYQAFPAFWNLFSDNNWKKTHLSTISLLIVWFLKALESKANDHNVSSLIGIPYIYIYMYSLFFFGGGLRGWYKLAAIVNLKKMWCKLEMENVCFQSESCPWLLQPTHFKICNLYFEGELSTFLVCYCLVSSVVSDCRQVSVFNVNY